MLFYTIIKGVQIYRLHYNFTFNKSTVFIFVPSHIRIGPNYLHSVLNFLGRNLSVLCKDSVRTAQ